MAPVGLWPPSATMVKLQGYGPCRPPWDFIFIFKKKLILVLFLISFLFFVLILFLISFLFFVLISFLFFVLILFLIKKIAMAPVGHHSQEKSRSQDNPLNPLENNRIKKTIVFQLRYEQKLYLILLGESNGMKIGSYI